MPDATFINGLADVTRITLINKFEYSVFLADSTSLTRLAGRPGEIPGVGPIDPWLARDLAAAAARNPATTWCVTVTDEQGHAVGHGCARPEPTSYRNRAGPGTRDGPGFSFTATAGRTCLCNGGPKCRRDHRLKQDPRWKVDQLPDGTFQWTTPSGRTYITEPTRYPI